MKSPHSERHRKYEECSLIWCITPESALHRIPDSERLRMTQLRSEENLYPVTGVREWSAAGSEKMQLNYLISLPLHCNLPFLDIFQSLKKFPAKYWRSRCATSVVGEKDQTQLSHFHPINSHYIHTYTSFDNSSNPVLTVQPNNDFQKITRNM